MGQRPHWLLPAGEPSQSEGRQTTKENEMIELLSSGNSYLDNKEDVRTGVGDVENGRPWKGGHGTFLHVVVQHVSDFTGVTVQVKWLGYFLFLLCIIQRHDCKYWFNVQIKSAGKEHMYIKWNLSNPDTLGGEVSWLVVLICGVLISEQKLKYMYSGQMCLIYCTV